MLSISEIEKNLAEVVDMYPPRLQVGEKKDVRRTAWHLNILQNEIPSGGLVVDIGGGIGIMSPGAAKLGFRSVLVDDFRDSVNFENPINTIEAHRRLGVKIISANVLEMPVPFEANSVDAVTCFQSMEHWHNSPKRLFRDLVGALKPGGLFFLGVPNCVDIRVRVTVPFGLAKWSTMEDWYEAPLFRGHVREPDIDDLRYIAKDLGLVNCRYLGKNWQAWSSGRAWVKALAPLLAEPLEIFPGLCSDIYLVARKPAQTAKT